VALLCYTVTSSRYVLVVPEAFHIDGDFCHACSKDPHELRTSASLSGRTCDHTQLVNMKLVSTSRSFIRPSFFKRLIRYPYRHFKVPKQNKLDVSMNNRLSECDSPSKMCHLQIEWGALSMRSASKPKLIGGSKRRNPRVGRKFWKWLASPYADWRSWYVLALNSVNNGGKLGN
jgi:hypothetical protein